MLWRSPCYSARELFTLTPKLLGLKADLYHATHYVLPYLLPCRAVVTIHDIIHLLYPEFLPNRVAFLYAERMIRRALEHGDRILTVSRNTKADLERYFDIAGDKIETIYNGIDESFRQPIAAGALPERLRGLGIAPGYVLFVGNPKPHKNLDNVLKAYAQAVHQADLPQPLVCVGDRESLDGRLRLRAEQLGIADRLILLGHVDQEVLPAIYQGAALFLYPTLYEGFGLPVAEAMASGSRGDHLQHLGAQGDRRRLRPPGQPARRRRHGRRHRRMPEQRRPPRRPPAARPAARRRFQLEKHRRADPGGLRAGAGRQAPRRPGRVSTALTGSAGVPPARLPRWERGRPARSGPAPSIWEPWRQRFSGLKVALVHDWLNGMRGGEKVLETIGRLFPGGADLHPAGGARGALARRCAAIRSTPASSRTTPSSAATTAISCRFSRPPSKISTSAATTS